jgi:hypothetical protein
VRAGRRGLLRRGWGCFDGPGPAADDAHPIAIAVAGGVALDVDGDAGRNAAMSGAGGGKDGLAGTFPRVGRGHRTASVRPNIGLSSVLN